VHGKLRRVPKKVKFAAPGASSEGEVTQLEHERIVELEQQLSSSVAAQTVRDRRIAQLIDELAPKSALLSALLEQPEANAYAVKDEKRAGLELQKREDQVLVQTSRVKQKDVELVSLQAKLDELLLSRAQDARALDQAQSALQKAKADADERIGQYETELAEVRAELQARKSELEASPFTTARASALVRADSSNRSPESNIPRRRSR
jgi:chromosome segregation ATPase